MDANSNNFEDARSAGAVLESSRRHSKAIVDGNPVPKDVFSPCAYNEAYLRPMHIEVTEDKDGREYVIASKNDPESVMVAYLEQKPDGKGIDSMRFRWSELKELSAENAILKAVVEAHVFNEELIEQGTAVSFRSDAEEVSGRIKALMELRESLEHLPPLA